MKKLSRKQMRSSKKRYHLRWKEEQDSLRQESKRKKSEKKIRHGIRLQVQAHGKFHECAFLNSFNEFNEFDLNKYFLLRDKFNALDHFSSNRISSGSAVDAD